MDDLKVMNDRVRTPFSKGITSAFGIIMLALGIATGTVFWIIIGPILVWSAFFTKYTIVNEEGITVHYDARVFKYKEEWLFSDITNLHREKARDRRYSILHFTKGAMSKRLVFLKEDAQRIIRLALKNNIEIHFDEAF